MGKITCKFKTIELEDIGTRGTPDEDYLHAEGLLEFQQEEISKIIKVRILPREDSDERGELFGVKIYDPQPKDIAKISMKDTCLVEIV